MTFEQFQASRRWVDDIGGEGTQTDTFGEICPGYVYAGGLSILGITDPRAPTLYGLVTGTKARVSEDLESLERDLYAYAIDEGIIDAGLRVA